MSYSPAQMTRYELINFKFRVPLQIMVSFKPSVHMCVILFCLFICWLLVSCLVYLTAASLSICLST